MTAERDDFVGEWKIIESSARFLPVAGILRVDESLRGGVRWPDASHHGFDLFRDGAVEGGRLRSESQKPNPGSGGPLRCLFSMVQETGTGGRGRLLYGLVQVDGDRGDSSTGLFVAEEVDTEHP